MEINKPTELYHGSTRKINGPLQPILKHETLDHIHDKPSVFATERMDLASLFMFPLSHLASIGFEHDIAYICIWGASETFAKSDQSGFLYILPPASFEKIGKGYEWQSFTPVKPLEVRRFESAINGMMQCGAQVYFINDNDIFDRIVTEKSNRSPILKNMVSENQRYKLNVKLFI